MSILTLSSRSSVPRPSPTLAITAKANALKAAGADVISFGAGEPDFNTPEPICQAAVEALRSGFTKYTPSTGTVDLKQAIVDKLARENNLKYEPNQIVVSCGAKHSLYNAMWAVLEPGDEVLLFAPYWMTYYDQVRLCGGVPVIVHTQAEDNFVPSIEAIKAKITAKTKLIVVNSPSNPTGAVFPRETMKEIAALALRHNLWIISDEIYERLIYDVEHTSIAGLSAEVKEQTIVIGGCSKTYAMTGWRIGYLAAPAAVTKAIGCFQDQVTSNPTSFAQKGAVAAFSMDPAVVETMRREFHVRRDLALGELAKIPGLVVPMPKGAFYVFFGVQQYLRGAIKNDVELAEHLLESALVATVPGSVFEGDGFLRMSYTASQENIVRGIGRIGDALAKLA